MLEAVARRLIKFGHSKDNILSRIYGFEDNEFYLAAAKNGPLIGANLEVRKYNDFLTDGVNMKFDVIVGNPPYQSNNGSGVISGSGPKSLWFQFIQKSIQNLNDFGYLCFITPENIFTSSNSIFCDFRGKKAKYQVHTVIDSTKFFSIGQRTAAWVIEKVLPFRKTCFHQKLIDLRVIDFIVLRGQTIIDKLAASNPKLTFSTSGQISPKERSEKRTEEFKFPYDANGKIYYSKEKSVDWDYHKVLIPQLSSKKPYASKNSNSPSTMKMVLENESQAINLTKVLNSKLFSFAFDCLRIDGRLSQSINILPKVDLTRSWTDQELYDHFNLTDEEIKLIEETIRD